MKQSSTASRVQLLLLSTNLFVSSSKIVTNPTVNVEIEFVRQLLFEISEYLP